jgi:DNA-binding HxlR family transcriptional regulator
LIRCRGKDYHCALEYAVDIIGGKWKPRIILFLGDNKTIRFGELERLLPETTRKVLVEQLKELEHDDVIMRTAYPQVPPKVEYSLTKQGEKLLPIMHTLRAWGNDHICSLNQKDGIVPCET